MPNTALISRSLPAKNKTLRYTAQNNPDVPIVHVRHGTALLPDLPPSQVQDNLSAPSDPAFLFQPPSPSFPSLLLLLLLFSHGRRRCGGRTGCTCARSSSRPHACGTYSCGASSRTCSGSPICRWCCRGKRSRRTGWDCKGRAGGRACSPRGTAARRPGRSRSAAGRR